MGGKSSVCCQEEEGVDKESVCRCVGGKEGRKGGGISQVNQRLLKSGILQLIVEKGGVWQYCTGRKECGV